MSRVLYDFWRSSAAYRVRIALGLKGLDHDLAEVDLLAGAQASDEYRARNPQGLVPFLVDGEAGVSQSIAIIEYLDEIYPEPPLLPRDPVERARVRALALTVACDIHPLNNLRVLKHLRRNGLDQDATDAWQRHWIEIGFASLEVRVAGPYCAGEDVTMADVLLVPQMTNARRVNTDLSAFPRLLGIEERLRALPAFAAAAPDAQPRAKA